MVKSVRPALGLEPYLIDTIIGKKAKYDLDEKLPLLAEDFEQKGRGLTKAQVR